MPAESVADRIGRKLHRVDESGELVTIPTVYFEKQLRKPVVKPGRVLIGLEPCNARAAAIGTRVHHVTRPKLQSLARFDGPRALLPREDAGEDHRSYDRFVDRQHRVRGGRCCFGNGGGDWKNYSSQLRRSELNSHVAPFRGRLLNLAKPRCRWIPARGGERVALFLRPDQPEAGMDARSIA